MDEPGEKDLLETLAKAQAMSDALRQAYRPIPKVVEVSDRTNALTITIEDHGARVTRVLLAAGWQDKIAASSLGATVMETIYSAKLGNVKEFFDDVFEKLNAPSPSPAPSPPPPPTDMASLIAGLNWDDLGGMLETVHKALDSVSTDAAPDMTNETISGFSDNRRVEVTLIADQPSSVTIDEKWVKKANRQQISDALRQAFEAAYAEAAERPSVQTGDTAAIGDLKSIINKFGITFPPPPRQGR